MNNLNKLYSDACKPLLKGNFFTQEEYKKNYGKLTILAGCVREIEKKLNKFDRYENRD